MSDPAPSEKSGMNRRDLMRAGAWAAPAVLIAAATPQASASGDATLAFNNATVWIASESGTPVGISGTTSFRVDYSPTANTVTSAALILTMNATGMLLTPVATSGAGWVGPESGVLDGNGSISYTFAWAGSLDPDNAGSSSPLNFTIPCDATAIPKELVALLSSPQASNTPSLSGAVTLLDTFTDPAVLS
jgi:hypothetical protein